MESQDIPGKKNKIVKIKLRMVTLLHEFSCKYTANGGMKSAMMTNTNVETIFENVDDKSRTIRKMSNSQQLGQFSIETRRFLYQFQSLKAVSSRFLTTNYYARNSIRIYSTLSEKCQFL